MVATDTGFTVLVYGECPMTFFRLRFCIIRLSWVVFALIKDFFRVSERSHAVPGEGTYDRQNTQLVHHCNEQEL